MDSLTITTGRTILFTPIMHGLIQSYLNQKPIFDEPPRASAPPPPTPKKIAPVKKEQPSEKKSNEMESLFGKLAPNLLIDPPIVLLWKNREDLPFLEKVAEAITKFVETAECREWDEKYFGTAKVIVAEASLLNMSCHQFEKNPIRLGMYKTSEYMKSVELKRDLWKLLQSINDLLA